MRPTLATVPADPVISERFWLNLIDTLLLTHLVTFVGFLLALLITGRMINERRNPSNIFAWSLLVFFVPWIGVPLFFLFGGRKSLRLVANKKRVLDISREVMRDRADQARRQEHRAPGEDQRRFEGNRCHLLGNGEVAFEALCNQIKEAKKSIHIMTYILGRDETGDRVLELLTEKAKEGVDVKLLVDALGCFGRMGRRIAPLKAAGGRVVSFMPMLPLQTKTSANLRNHRKIAIFDSRSGIIGGQNIDRRFMGAKPCAKRFLDFNILVEGPIVITLNRIFVTDWCFASGDEPAHYRELLGYLPEAVGQSELETIPSGPDIEDDPLWEKIISMVQECRKEITIVTPYFLPDQVLFQSLIVKAHAGYRVKIIVPAKSNQPVVDFARGHYLHRLRKAGADIRLYQPGMLHAKLIIVDGTQALIGSANIDMRSLFVNFEVGMDLSSPEDVQALTQWVDQIIPHCLPYDDTKAAQAGANRRLAEDFAHLIAPLL